MTPHPSWTPEQLELLEKIKQFLREEPRRFDMGSWGKHIKGKPNGETPPCRTVFCLAGTALVVSGQYRYRGKRFKLTAEEREYFGQKTHTKYDFWPASKGILELERSSDKHDPLFWKAVELLGLSEAEGDTLFYAAKWPSPFEEEYNRLEYFDYFTEEMVATERKERQLEVGMARLDHFIETRL